MSSNLALCASLAGVISGTTALADVPKVAVDIAPVHSLVARVMEGLGSPGLIIPAGASPHEYSLRPSEARALEQADLVFMIGGELSPWLEDAVETLAADATVTEFLHESDTQLLETRESALFEAHTHEEAHATDHDDYDDHGAHDPHAWLSPINAKAWLNLIAARLSAADPQNAGAYFANAAAGQAELDTLITEVNGILEPARGRRFVVFHDAYQYFEAAFDFPAAGAISVSDAADPSPARIAEIRDRIRDEGIDCILSEPQFNMGLVGTVLDGSRAATAVSDPLGSRHEPGTALYPALLKSLATALADCK